MALTGISNLNNPYDPLTPFTDGYAYISGLTLDVKHGRGSLTYDLHPSEAAAGSGGTPIGQQPFTLGSAPFPSFAELMGDPTFATAFGAIASILDGYAKQYAAFAGSEQTT